MNKLDLKTYHGVLMKDEVPDIDVYDLALEACVRAIKAESDAEDYHDIMINTVDRVRVLEAFARELVEALEEATWLLEGYTGRYEDIERLKKELVKAKEVLGDE